ncbi:MAG: UDP-N-acetylmuramate dehydrogenase [Verrucomicrobiota bacterium]
MSLSGQSLFFVGIGGMGMLPLALFARAGGARVSGFDDNLTPRGEHLLEDAGVEISELFAIPDGLDRIVVSSAILPGHWLYRELESKGLDIPVIRRGELLAELARDYRLMAVAGSHGKTTTSALLAFLAEREGWSADYVVGGLPEGALTPSRNGGREWLIAEIDESDGTIESFSPEVTLFLNFDWDHTDRYKDRGQMRAAWKRLAERSTGSLILPDLTSLDDDEKDWISDWDFDGDRVYFPNQGNFLKRNVSAAETAYRVASGQDLSDSALNGFPGVWRRQTFHRKDREFAVVEDYAHHPREVSAFLAWLDAQDLPQPLRVFFQPHRFSRTTRFVDEFVEALSGLTEVYLHSIYGAGETLDVETDPLALIRSGLEQRGVRVGHARFLDDFPKREGTFAFVGAGDANDWAPLQAVLSNSKSRTDALVDLGRTVLRSSDMTKDQPLAPYTTMRLGGNASILARPGSVAELGWLLRTARLLELPIVYLGNGSNILVTDEGFEGLAIHLAGSPWEKVAYHEETGEVVLGAGLALPRLARWAAGEGLSGFSFGEGIPGTVGGALRMNAGSMGGWIGDRVVRVDTLDKTGKRISLSRKSLDFGYRSCPQLEGLCIIQAVLKPLGRESPEAIRSEMKDYALRRRLAQPGGPSAGCLFRNPDGDSAGRLIDLTGLKGFSVGGAMISEKHANFATPQVDASALEMVELMAAVRQKVWEETGVTLEPEVKFVGRHGFIEPLPPLSMNREAGP